MSTALPATARTRLWAPMIAAVIAFVMAIVPGLSFLAWIPAIAAIVLGIISLVRGTRKGPAVAGVVIGTVAWMIAITVSINTLAELKLPPAHNEVVPLIRQSDAPTPPTHPAPEVVVEEETAPVEPAPAEPDPVAPVPAVPAPPPAAPAPPPAPVAPVPPPAVPAPVQPAPPPPPAAAVSYKNCAEVRAAGAAPIRAGEPGFGKHLDRDGDGVGCE